MAGRHGDGGVVEYDAAACTYRLPAEHVPFLTDASGTNLAVTAQLLPVATRAMDRVVECFHKGGGTHYHEYPCFHACMAEESAQSVVAHLFTAILPLVPGVLERLGQGIAVMDAGCGQGRALLAMAERFPKSRFVGLDLCEDALDAGWRMARERNLTNVFFEARDLSDFAEPEAFDLITTFDAVHDQKNPAGLLRGIARSLKPGGTYLMQDIGGSSFLERNLENPFAPLLYAMSTLHCMPVSLGQGGAGLGTMWGVELAENMLREAGFRDITCHRLEHDPVNAYFVSRA
ncbi:class I SAM-dependent methyltransferase [Aerophototrophica crusticola]|uniref:class I SAM-dependent methyltransferase n=1 Tax=Aerophototrophica crusticola TaxID=1709002 RepID=UPI00384DCCC8